MRTIFIKLLIIILPVACLVAITNYRVDPANIFSSSEYIGGIAEILSKGHNVDNLTNYDERLLQEQMVKRLHKSPDIAVLGSSRIMEIGSDFFPGKSVLNCGVSHGGIRDLVAITGLLDSLGRLPGEVVIGLDPYMIGKGGSSEWESLSAYYGSFLHKIRKTGNRDYDHGSPIFSRKLSSFFSLDYFKSSIDFVARRHSKRYLDVGAGIPLSGRFSDGTISYPDTYRNPDTLKVALDAGITGLKNGLPQPDSVSMGLLNELLDFLQQRRIVIRFVMTPYHPEFYAAINERQPLLFHYYETFVKELGVKRNIPVTGGFDADSLGIPRSQFYDMYHCSKAALVKIFRESDN